MSARQWVIVLEFRYPIADGFVRHTGGPGTKPYVNDSYASIGPAGTTARCVVGLLPGRRLFRVSPGRAFPKGLGVMADDQVRGVVAGQLASIGSIRGAHDSRPQTLFFFQVIVIEFEFDQLVGDGL